MTGPLVNHPLNVVLKDNHKGPGGGRENQMWFGFQLLNPLTIAQVTPLSPGTSVSSSVKRGVTRTQPFWIVRFI